MKRQALVATGVVALLFLLILGASRASATNFTFTGSGTNPDDPSATLAASVTFSITGSTLTVTLSNIGQANLIGNSIPPTDVLTAVYFNTPSGTTLTPVSASFTTTLWNPDGNTIGAEWGYNTGSGAGGFNSGIGSSGLDIFGQGNFGCGGSCQNVGGFQWGLVPNSYAGQKIGGKTAPTVIANTGVFNLTISGAPLDLGQLGSVRLQYGTSINEANLNGSVPDGGMTLMLLGGALVGLATLRQRFRA
jgi:hypothetical protein